MRRTDVGSIKDTFFATLFVISNLICWAFVKINKIRKKKTGKLYVKLKVNLVEVRLLSYLTCVIACFDDEKIHQ